MLHGLCGMRVRLLLAALLTLIGSLSATAQEKPVLTVYTYASFVGKYGPGSKVKAAFEAQCSCRLDWVAADDAGSLLGRLRLEGAATKADIVLGLDMNLAAEAEATGLFQPHGQDTSSLTLPIAWSDATMLPFDWGYLAFVYDSTKHAVAGFENRASGMLRFDGRDLIGLKPAQRPVSILFQDHNLFPHLDVFSNVALGLKPSLRLDEGERSQVEAALAEVDLAGFAARMPAGLSGGQRQRVALARALLRGKPLMLLDEPFGALDPGLRREMIARVDALRRRHGLTVLMTIHTPEEVAERAELFAFVAQGRVAATGPWTELAAASGPVKVQRFLGRGSLKGDEDAIPPA